MFQDDGSIEIVGVSKNLRERQLTGRPIPLMYVPVTQANISGIRASHTYFPMSWVVRTQPSTAELIAAIREAMRATDPKQPFSSFTTMEEVKSGSMSTETFQMRLLSGLAGLGLLLAFRRHLRPDRVHGRRTRTRVRHSHGARARRAVRILQQVLRQGAVLGFRSASPIGAGAALALNRTLRDFVYGVSTVDPLTFVVVGVVLMGAAGVASLVPALRAVRMNPVTALRE